MDALIERLAAPVALLVIACAAVWRRGLASDSALLAAHAERIASLERRADDCERQRDTLSAALSALAARRRTAVGQPPTKH